MKHTALAIAIIVFWFFPAFASAQTPEDLALIQADGPSSGTFLGAALETVGYRAQAMVLQQMWPLIQSLALLIWVSAAIFILFEYAMYGSTENVLWLFLGPILFLFVVRTTEVAAGVDWRIGNSKPQPHAAIARGQTSEVSWTFHKVNETISNFVRNVTGVLSQDGRRAELKKFMNRQRILQDLLSAQINDGGLLAFSVGTLASCNQEMNAARQIALGKRDAVHRATAEYKEAVNGFSDSWKRPTKSVPDNAAAREYFGFILDSQVPLHNTLNAVCRDVFDKTIADFEAVGRNKDVFVEKPVSCEQLWCLMGVGVHEEVNRTLDASQVRYGLDGATWREMLRDVAQKLNTPEPFLDLKGQPVRGIIPAKPDPSVIPVIVGGYMVRKALEKDFRSGILTQLGDRAGIERYEANFRLDLSRDQNMKHLHHGMVHQIAEAKKFEFFVTTMMLPYYQGLLLYGLAFLFPFFALLILIPGKAQGFFLWFGMWLWVKSWDIGWALLALVDDVLWELMPRNSQWKILEDPNHSPISVFEAAFQGDPAYSLATYYTVMGMLLIAVPLLMSQTLLGSAHSVTSRFLNGAGELGSRLGGLIQAGVANRQLMDVDYLREIHYARFASQRFNVDQTPDAKYIRQGIAEMRRMAAAWRSQPAVPLPLAIAIPGSTLNNHITTHQAALAFERQANDIEGALGIVNGNFALFKAADTVEGFNLDALRAGLSERGEFWNQPGPNTGGYQEYRSQAISMATAAARINSFYDLRRKLQLPGIK